MCIYFDFGFISIPSYGFMIALGVISANIIALFVLHKTKLDFNDLMISEAYCFLGAFTGAKGLYLFISANSIHWGRIFEPTYFNELMQGGFVFYGGLIGGLIFVLVSGKIHNINSSDYIREFIFLVPLIHAFGRIGCFFAGCCYGIPYNGFGAVVFPGNSYAIANIKLFPVQLVEATLLLGVSFFILYLQVKRNWKYTIETYLLLYAMIRFGLEYFRYDSDRGYFLFFSTSQWISLILIIVAVTMIYRKNS